MQVGIRILNITMGWRQFIPEQFTVKAHPNYLKGRGEEGGRGKKVSTNTFIPVYIHIQTQTLKSNISKSGQDREKVSVEVKIGIHVWAFEW